MNETEAIQSTESERSPLGLALIVAGFGSIVVAGRIAAAALGMGLSKPWTYTSLTQALDHSNLTAFVYVTSLLVIIYGVFKHFGGMERNTMPKKHGNLAPFAYFAVLVAALIAGYFIGAVDERAFTIRYNFIFLACVFPAFVFVDALLSGRYVIGSMRAASLPVLMALVAQFSLNGSRPDAISQNAIWAAAYVALLIVLVAFSRWFRARRTTDK